MKLKEKIIEKFGHNKLVRAFVEEYGFRAFFFLIIGTLVTLFFAGFNGITAAVNNSLWYGAFAGYYVILFLQKLTIILIYQRIKNKYGNNPVKLDRAKTKLYLVNGIVLMIVDIALAVIAGVMVLYGKPVKTYEIMAIATATYTFYRVVWAVRNLIIARKINDITIQTIRNIGFVESLVALLSLETTLITTFGELDGTMLEMISITGIAVCAFVVALSVFMIVKGVRKLRRLKKENE